MDGFLSTKLRFFSFWLMVGVVLLHSKNIFLGKSIPSFIESLFSENLTQICVPLFFMISGFLFFRNENSSIQYLEKIKKRIKSLLIPYILWCLGIFLLIFVLQQLPGIGNFFPQKFMDMSLKDNFLNAIIYPYNYPFWFIRELLLYVCLTPVIKFLIDKNGLVLPIFLFLLGIITDSFLQLAVKVIQVYPFFYYVLGCYLGIKKLDIKINKNLTLILGIFYLFINILFANSSFDMWLSPESMALIFLNNFKNLAGCIFVWGFYDCMMGLSMPKIPTYYKYSFFIFALHGIPATMISKITQVIVRDEFLKLILYFASWIALTIISMLIGKFIDKKFPKLYNILVGNRQ